MDTRVQLPVTADTTRVSEGGQVSTADRETRESEAEEFFADFYPRLAGWCRGLVDSDAAAHDVASEAFTRLWSRWRSVERPDAYLFSIAANLVKDYWRDRDRERHAARHWAGGREHAPAADQGFDLRSLVESLPDRLRVPVLLYYYAGLPVNDIAAVLRRRPGTVKSDLHAARQRLRLELRGLHDITRFTT